MLNFTNGHASGVHQLCLGVGNGLMTLIPFLWSDNCQGLGRSFGLLQIQLSTGCILAQQETLDCLALEALEGLCSDIGWGRHGHFLRCQNLKVQLSRGQAIPPPRSQS